MGVRPFVVWIAVRRWEWEKLAKVSCGSVWALELVGIDRFL